MTEKLKALGETNRYRICMMLREGELCVCQLLDILGIAGGTLSQHLKVLKSAELISTRRQGKWIYYAIKDENSLELLNYLYSNTENRSALDKDLENIKPACQINKN